MSMRDVIVALALGLPLLLAPARADARPLPAPPQRARSVPETPTQVPPPTHQAIHSPPTARPPLPQTVPRDGPRQPRRGHHRRDIQDLKRKFRDLPPRQKRKAVRAYRYFRSLPEARRRALIEEWRHKRKRPPPHGAEREQQEGDEP